MTTDTQIGTDFVVQAIAPNVVSELLERDDAGNKPRLITDDEGGAPLRCCLRRSLPGERIALLSYAPLRRWAGETGAEPGPYVEVGPVFVHAGPCAGPAGAGWSELLADGNRVLRAYSADGHILGGRPWLADEREDRPAAAAMLASMFADREVALVHARAMEFGCFLFEARRA